MSGTVNFHATAFNAKVLHYASNCFKIGKVFIRCQKELRGHSRVESINQTI